MFIKKAKLPVCRAPFGDKALPLQFCREVCLPRMMPSVTYCVCSMSLHWLSLITIITYFGLLLLVSWLTGRGGSNDVFFRAGHKSPWYLVAFGMIGASISGVSFVSVPGYVGLTQMTYLQMCLGFFLGYVVVAYVLLPVYYRRGLTTIYSYLADRLGQRSRKTGAAFFVLSKLARASASFCLVCMILQQFVFGFLGVVVAVALAGYLYINSSMGANLLQRQETISSNSIETQGYAGSAFMRIYRGYYIFRDYPLLQKFIGNDNNDYIKAVIAKSEYSWTFYDETYVNAVQAFLIYTGIVGTIFFVLFFITQWRRTNYCGKTIMAILLALSFVASLHFTLAMALYLLIPFGMPKET